jgi:hypothetical protein
MARRQSGGAGDRGLAGHDRARAVWASARPPPAAATAPARARMGACDWFIIVAWRVWRRAAQRCRLSGDDGKVQRRPGLLGLDPVHCVDPTRRGGIVEGGGGCLPSRSPVFG